jgi:hypothetical protein
MQYKKYQLTNIVTFAYLKYVILRCSSSLHQQEQRYANAFSSPKHKLLLSNGSHIPHRQTANCVFRGTKRTYRRTSRTLFLQR